MRDRRDRRDAYSIGVLLWELASQIAPGPQLQIFATDSDDGAFGRPDRRSQSAERSPPDRPPHGSAPIAVLW